MPTLTPHVAAPAMAWSLMDPEETAAELREGLRAILAAGCIPQDQVEVDLPFAEMGLNSVMAISIRRQLEQFVGLELSATMLFNHPHDLQLRQLSGHRLVPERPPMTQRQKTIRLAACWTPVRHRRVDVITTKGSPRWARQRRSLS